MATITGNNYANTLTGTAYSDTINGYGGNDLLYGRAGNDTINAGDGDDSLWGEQGDDILFGNAGADKIYASDGNDVLWGGSGNDSLYGDGGTDTLKGESGADTLKGGSGISRLYGGTENDTLVYDPTTDNIAKFGNYLSPSVLSGEAGTDTLQIFNKATYTSGTTVKPTMTHIYVDGNTTGHITFADDFTGSRTVEAGTFNGVEKVVVTGSGGLYYETTHSSTPGIDITGTSVSDLFSSGVASDTMRGGGGNDEFSLGGYMGGGNDVIYGGSGDADIFHFDFVRLGNATIKDFNGAGSLSGDMIRIPDYIRTEHAFDVTYSNGSTVFSIDDSAKLTVEGVNLTQNEGIDWIWS